MYLFSKLYLELSYWTNLEYTAFFSGLHALLNNGFAFFIRL